MGGYKIGANLVATIWKDSKALQFVSILKRTGRMKASRRNTQELPILHYHIIIVFYLYNFYCDYPIFFLDNIY